MKEFVFKLPTRIVFGQGASTRLGPLCREFGAEKVMVVTDRVIGASQGFQGILKGLEEDGIDYQVYDQVVPEPPVETVDAAADSLKKIGYGMVIAVGGGSSIDTSKAICALATNEGSARDYLFGGSRTLTHRPLPLVAVPTTAGSGSEVTAASVLSDEQRGIKLSITHDWLIPLVAVDPNDIPTLAIIDPELMLSMPRGLTAATGMDALTHAVEAYVSRNASPVSDAMAVASISRIGASLRLAASDPENMEARSEMAIASVLAGAAFVNGGLGAVHGISQAIGGVAHVSHGVANALLLPYVCRRNLPGTQERFATIARLLGERTEQLTLSQAAEAAVNAIEQLQSDLRLPSKRSQVGVTREMFPEIVKGAMEYRLMGLNPVKLTEQDVTEILEAAF